MTAATSAEPIALYAFGRDGRWAALVQQLLQDRPGFVWRGLFAGDTAPTSAELRGAVWLIDGDDEHSERPAPNGLPADWGAPRLCFYRQPDVAALRQCAARGASACLDKQPTVDELVHAIEAAKSGLFATDRLLLARALAAERRAPAPLAGLSHLTERQREIVHWASMGLSNKQIGRRLGISPETVKSHLHQIFAREGISGRVALLALHRAERRPSGEPSSTPM